MEDRILIRERIAAYGDAAYLADIEAFVGNWMEDCVWCVAPGVEFRGKAGVRENWTNVWAAIEAVLFYGDVGSIEVQGDRATARVYCQEVLFGKGGQQQKLMGAYSDELVRQNGVWLFARRQYRLLSAEGVSPF